MNKNILMVIDSLNMGGAERITLTLSSLLISAGHHVDIITIYDQREYDLVEGVQVYSIDYQKRKFQNIIYKYKLFSKIKELSKQYENGYDLILVHLLSAARLMQKYQHKNIYYIMHNNLSSEVLSNHIGAKRKRRMRRIQKKFKDKNIVTVSQGVLDDLLNVMHIEPKSAQLIYNPININEIQHLSHERYQMISEPYIIHVGRFVEQKRHDWLIEAYDKSKVAGKLVLIGDGHLRSDIEEQIQRLNLKDRVILLGKVNNPYPLIEKASLLVLSSEFEGLSMAILEALALNTPVLSFDCPSGPGEILGGFSDESLVSNGDTDALALKIKNQMDNPSTINPHILDRFDGQLIAQKYIDLIK